jgi:hypothetical protein
MKNNEKSLVIARIYTFLKLESPGGTFDMDIFDKVIGLSSKTILFVWFDKYWKTFAREGK